MLTHSKSLYSFVHCISQARAKVTEPVPVQVGMSNTSNHGGGRIVEVSKIHAPCLDHNTF